VNVYSYLHEFNVCIVCCVVAVVMLPRRARTNPPTNNIAPNSSAAVLAVLRAMQQELATLRQAIPVAPMGSASTAATQGATIGVIHAGVIPTGAVPGGAAEVAHLVSDISLM
jgi:hypothetical protein